MRKIFVRALALLLCCMLSVPGYAEEEVLIPGQVTAIEAETFYGDESMTRAVIPEGTLSIGELAFAYSGLTSVVLPASLEEIAENAFEGCDGLKAIVHADSYALLYCREKGIEYRLCPEDLAALYSVTALRRDGNELIAEVSTYESCSLMVQVLSEEDETVLHTFIGAAEADLEFGEAIAVILETAVMPSHYILRAVLIDEDGTELCKPFTSLHYTSAFEQFENNTPEDYEGGEVLDYGEYGFAVAASGAIRIPSIASSADGNTYTFSADSVPQAGSVLLLTTDGAWWEPIKVRSAVDNGNGTVSIVRDPGATLSDLYDAVKISAVMNAGSAVNAADSIFDDPEGSQSLTSRIEAGPLSVAVTGEVVVGAQSYYDKTLLGESYTESEVYVDLNLIAEATVSAGCSSEDYKQQMGGKPTEMVLFEGPIAIYGPGAPLAVELKVSLPLEYELEGGGTFTMMVSNRAGYRHTPDGGVQPFKEKDGDYQIVLGGGFMVQLGAKIEMSAVVLRGLFDATIAGQAGIRAEGEFGKEISLSEKTHGCHLCAEVDPMFFADITGDLAIECDDDYKVKLFDFEVMKLQVSLAKGYVSMINDADSPFGGKITFGKGECPNYKYRVLVRTQDIDGNEVSGIPVRVNAGDEERGSGVSPYKIFLYNGAYNAEADFESRTFAQDFEVFRSPQDVTVQESTIGLSGTVTDAASGAPVSGAKVRAVLSEDRTIATMTNDDGFYLIEVPPVDAFGVEISADGYLNWSDAVELGKDHELTLDAELIPSTYTVTFMPGGGTGTMESLTVGGGESFMLPECGFTPPSGMEFKEWVIDDESYAAGSTYASPAGDVVVYADWKKELIPADAVEYNGHSYKFFATALGWAEARVTCEAMGGHLVSITSAGEQSFLNSYISGCPGNGYIWIGTAHPWTTWVTGEAVGYTNWGTGEPDNWSGQVYGCLLYNDEYKGSSYHICHGQWDDWQGPATYFICEWDFT